MLSPGLLKKVVYAGSNDVSFPSASQALLHLAEVDIDPRVVRLTTERIGQERLAQRDLLVESFQSLPLVQRDRSPVAAVPALAVVMTDGGRLQILPDQALPKDNRGAPPEVRANRCAAGDATTQQPGGGPAGDPPATAAPPAAGDQTRSKQRCWREDKVAALMSMKSETHAADPCPELPDVFADPLVVLKLAREVGHLATVPSGTPFQSADSPEKQQEAQQQEQTAEENRQRQKRPGRPEVESRQVLATRQDNDAFGPMVAALAWSLGLMAALRQAFVADGSEANWSIHKKYFPRFVAIVDFIHVLSYVFAAAMAGRTFADGWEIYQEWISQVWKGEVKGVLSALRRRLEELAEGSKERAEVEKALGYLEGQKGRMDYGEYRKQGLPIMSSIIESTVKQIGRRVKGSEKFWKEDGAEAVLQLRADYLSDSQPMDHFWQQRADRMTGQRCYKKRRSA